VSGVTDPTEEYFKNGLWAWVTDQWKKLIGDAAGHLQVDVVESGLPTGAATSANQTAMLTALQLIDDLRAALSTVATDSLDVQLDGQTADVEVKQTTAADLTPGVMGWDGSAWRKLPLLWGYSDRYSEKESEDNVAAGTHYLSFTAVPEGEVWVITAYTAYCTTANPSSLRLGVIQGGIELFLAQQIPTVAGVLLPMTGQLVLRKDDYLRAGFLSCALNDDIRAFACGYKMKVAE